MSGRLVVSATSFPYSAAAIACYTSQAKIIFEHDRERPTLELNGSHTAGEDEIIQALATAGGLSDDSVKSPRFYTLARSLSTLTTFADIVVALDSLDNHLAFRTFLIGHDVTAADWAVWGSLKGSVKLIGLLRNQHLSHLMRWFCHIESLDATQLALASLLEAKADKARMGSKTAASFALGLQDAIMGQVVTRFPPEPSGYLHIGHAKAAMLNQYFAKMYNGKLIIRFDDTNPTKERSEFEETILEDLALLNIRGDKVTHTSDYFDQIYELAIQMIKSGKAYADDTDSSIPLDLPCACPPNSHGKQSQMAHERWHGLPSHRRDASVDENLTRFEEMKSGTEEGLRWCIRAKLSVDNPNKALRDPVIYRTNIVTHHRLGDKWKIYPTYDFACPIVDSIEGVTHALRTNEYRDRNAQYSWMIQAAGLRPVHIWDFSRLNFVYTLLSKRKLHYFVDQGLVRGWDDPRFPTVRGVRRRGMTVEALQQFMLSQGPSQAVVSLEWDSIWSLNKKVIDPVAPRFWAILKDNMVPVTIKGGPAGYVTKKQPKHKKNPDLGDKTMVYASSILIEQIDAISFEDREEITLMNWGNAFVLSKQISSTGVITGIELELHIEGDFRKTSKKVTWLAAPTPAHPLISVTLLDYDYLITKKKLEENDDLNDFITPVTEFREEGFADYGVVDLKKGDIIQLERKGYYIVDDSTRGGSGFQMAFIRIPDGKAASLASKAGAVASLTNSGTLSVEVSSLVAVNTKM